MSDPLPWYAGERLRADGIVIVNDGIGSTVQVDRKLIARSSSLAVNGLGKMAAKAFPEVSGAKSSGGLRFHLFSQDLRSEVGCFGSARRGATARRTSSPHAMVPCVGPPIDRDGPPGK